MIYNDKSLKRHNVSREEVDEVLRHPLSMYEDIGPSARGSDRLIWVGFTANLRLLEIGIEYLPDDEEYAFHASDASKPYIVKFLKRVKP